MEPPSGTGDFKHTIVHFNADRSLNSTACVSVSWLPSSQGSIFLSVHADGGIIKHHKITGNSSDKDLLSRSESQSSLRDYCSTQIVALSRGNVTAAALSPDGRLLAVATTDHGMLYIIDVESGHVVGGFRSFFGSFCCCTWSNNGQYVAAGGEDDLIAVWKLGSKHILAHCQGHTSWPTSCIFEYSSDTRLRLISVGQDCRLCIWEINIETEDQCAVGELSTQQIFVPSVKSNTMNGIMPVFCKKLHIDPLSFVTIVSDKYLVICAYDGTLKVYEKQDREEAN